MGKYIGYTIIIIVILFFLNWFNIIDIPFFDVDDFTAPKHEAIHKTEEAAKDVN